MNKLVNYLISVLVVVLLLWAVLFLNSRQQSITPVPQESPALVNESSEAGHFVNKTENLDFKYPAAWGALKEVRSDLKQPGEFIFTTDNKKIPGFIYHIQTGKIVYVENGQEISGTISGDPNPQQTLKLLLPSGQQKKIYTMPVRDVKSNGRIGAASFSPQGNYVVVRFSFYEWGGSSVFDLRNNKRFVLSDPSSVDWSANEKVLVVSSVYNEFMGSGENALFVSSTGSPQNLKKIFSRTSSYLPQADAEASGINGLDIHSLKFDEVGNVHFHVRLCAKYSFCNADDPTIYEGDFIYDPKTGKLNKE